MKFLIVISLLFCAFPLMHSRPKQGEEAAVCGIQFIPKEFNDIKLGYNQTEMLKTSPGYPNDVIKINTMAINTPTIIYYNDCDSSFKPVIPLSAIYLVSSERSLKYIHLIDQLIHVKNKESSIDVSGKINKKQNPDIDILYLPRLDAEKNEKEKREAIKQARKLTDDEIDIDVYSSGEFINVNIMEYVNFPFLPGKYEVWLSFSGLESNHTVVEIVKRNNVK